MAYIENPNYETFSVRCDHCKVSTLFNRVEVGRFTELISTNLVCPSCSLSFWVTGDIANSPYELFIWDADRHYAEKRYMLCIASLCLAWEMFLATFARTIYLDRPFFSSHDDDQSLEAQNELAELLHHLIRKFTFFPLRNLMINTLLHNVDPQNEVEARAAILRIDSENFASDVSPERIKQMEPSNTRHLLVDLQAVTVGCLRNKVLHQHAYRPSALEANVCLERERILIYRLRQAFGVDDYPSLSPLGP